MPSFGREQLSIPGPSVMPDRVLAAMHRPSPNIYEGALVDTYKTLIPDLRAVAKTKGDVATYIANGHGAWEASINNLFVPGDRILSLNTGRFAPGWANVARGQGIDVIEEDFGMSAPADPARLEEILRKDTGAAIRAVMVCQTDTATSALSDIPALRAAMDAAGHDALLMVDCIASLGCDAYDMDGWGVDVTLAACQKGLMTPAGVAFLFVGAKAKAARARARPSVYWDWAPRIDPDYFYQFFGGTAPTQHIYGLREALDILVHEEGVEAAIARHRMLSDAVWAAINTWGEKGALAFNMADPAHRSRAVTTLRTEPGYAADLRAWCAEQAGVTLGIGLGFGADGNPVGEHHFRIGHMGHLNGSMIMATLGAIDAGLKALNVPTGSGALDAASAVLAQPAG